MTNDFIGKSLGLPPIHDVEDAEIVSQVPGICKNTSVETTTREEQSDNDFDYARGNLYDVIEKGSTAMTDLMDIASQSQSPKAYEVLAATMRTLIDANKGLVEMSRRKAEDDSKQAGDSGPTNITNNLFVGTTHDLLKLIADTRKNDK